MKKGTHMADERHSIELTGCVPIPLASYLKALGILRIVAEQVDNRAQGWWEGDAFRLRSTMDSAELMKFFMNQYAPTPLVAPWNGGSGFFSGDNQEALLAIVNGRAKRLSAYREILEVCRELLASLSLNAKPDANQKGELLLLCRNRFPDAALPWLDAAYVFTSDGPKYPPLLGTGGNDGRLEFTNNFMQRLCELMNPQTGDPADARGDAISEAVFGTIGHQRSKLPIGQFDPVGAGGANAASGYDGAPCANPWDFVLMLEGVLLFASATVKRLERVEMGALAYPFCVQSAGVGYGSASETDETTSRNEMWFPLWDRPTRLDELASLFAEGRVERRARRARNGVDFARAIASLGIDRGIHSFERYGFQQRNGLAYFAVPLGRFTARGNPGVEELLAPIDEWFYRFQRVASSRTAPTRVAKALRRLQARILEFCQRGENRQVQNVLIALGQAESSLAVAPTLHDPKDGVNPLPPLPAEWVVQANDASPEFRLAAGLASIGWRNEDKVGPFRRHIEPIAPNTWHSSWPKWNETADDPGLVWGSGSLVDNMLAVLNRRMVDAIRYGRQPDADDLLFPGDGRCCVSLGDIAAFIDGRVDDRRLESLLYGLILLNWRSSGILQIIRQIRGPSEPIPDAAYALLKLCHLPGPIAGHLVPLTPAITRRAASGDLSEATRLAARRLKASRLPTSVDLVHARGQRARRVASALLFPVWHQDTAKKTDVTRLMDCVLRGDRLEPAVSPLAAPDNVSTPS